MDNIAYNIEHVSVDSLRSHPRNYREHPDDQIEHLKQSIHDHGFYRNVVIAKDGTILAGHGVVKAAMQMGFATIPVVCIDLPPEHPQALKILVGDNETARLAMPDDRALTELLKSLKDTENGLLGTGFDDSMLAGLLYVTRPASEIRSKDEAEHWVGMPEFGEAQEVFKVIVSFRTGEDRAHFADILGLEFTDSTRMTISLWWPPKDKEDLASLRFEG